MFDNVFSKSISGSLGRLWRAFVAGAGAFGDVVPQALASISAPKSDDPEEWISFALVAARTAARRCSVKPGMCVPDGFWVNIDPSHFRLGFSSFESRVMFIVPFSAAPSVLVVSRDYAPPKSAAHDEVCERYAIAAAAIDAGGLE